MTPVVMAEILLNSGERLNLSRRYKDQFGLDVRRRHSGKTKFQTNHFYPCTRLNNKECVSEVEIMPICASEKWPDLAVVKGTEPRRAKALATTIRMEL